MKNPYLFRWHVQNEPAERLTEAAREMAAELRAVMAPDTAWNVEPHPAELRVGFLSGDLRDHPVGYFMENVFRELGTSARSRLRIYAYPVTDMRDARTVRIQKTCFQWRPLYNLDDDAAAQAIRDDRIHVLVDLAGPTRFNRIDVLVRKPAPVIVSWLGFLSTSGIPGTDVILGDRWTLPPEEDHLYLEKVWHLPETYQCFTPPEDAPPVGRLPALKTGTFTFGSLNNISKLNSGVMALWAGVLAAVPQSRLVLQGFQTELTDRTPASLHAAFAAHDIDPARIEIRGPRLPRRNSLAAYNEMDLALDPFPYSGATTTCEALWQGVPVLTLKGDRFIAHCGESILHNVGIPQFIAADADKYVAKAVYWSEHLTELANLRADLREIMRVSPLCDAPRFARNFERTLFDIYEYFYGASHV